MTDEHLKRLAETLGLDDDAFRADVVFNLASQTRGTVIGLTRAVRSVDGVVAAAVIERFAPAPIDLYVGRSRAWRWVAGKLGIPKTIERGHNHVEVVAIVRHDVDHNHAHEVIREVVDDNRPVGVLVNILVFTE